MLPEIIDFPCINLSELYHRVISSQPYKLRTERIYWRGKRIRTHLPFAKLTVATVCILMCAVSAKQFLMRPLFFSLYYSPNSLLYSLKP